MNDNELRIDGPENLVSDPLACPGAALRCLEEDIGILNHLKEDFLTLFREVVESNRALVTALSLLDVGGALDRVAVFVEARKLWGKRVLLLRKRP